MSQQVTISTTHLNEVADLLEQASRALRRAVSLSAKEPTTYFPKPKKVAPEDEWFWTPEWQQKEREADEDMANGRYKTYNSAKELIADLHRLV